MSSGLLVVPQPTSGTGPAGSTTSGTVLVRFGHALSDPARARILLALLEEPRYPSEPAQLLNVSRQSLSDHLAACGAAGWSSP